MLSALDNFYLDKEEPLRSSLLALKDIIILQDKDIGTAWKYAMPFFCYKNKMFCYLWVDKKNQQPYIGFVEGKHLNHPQLVREKRSRMKIIRFNSSAELPEATIKKLVTEALDLYKTGKIKTK